MTTLSIVARIEAKSDQVELVKNALIKLIEPTRNENGCLQYDLHQDNENPEVFVFYENWQSRELWQIHMNNDHLKAYMEETEGAVVSFTLNEMAVVQPSANIQRG
ncbi:MAG: putative quinol monooxygenase [Oleispira sp.]